MGLKKSAPPLNTVSHHHIINATAQEQGTRPRTVMVALLFLSGEMNKIKD